MGGALPDDVTLATPKTTATDKPMAKSVMIFVFIREPPALLLKQVSSEQFRAFFLSSIGNTSADLVSIWCRLLDGRPCLPHRPFTNLEALSPGFSIAR
jgi:hypothetical protein